VLWSHFTHLQCLSTWFTNHNLTNLIIIWLYVLRQTCFSGSLFIYFHRCERAHSWPWSFFPVSTRISMQICQKCFKCEKRKRNSGRSIEMFSDSCNSVAEMVTSLYILHLCYYWIWYSCTEWFRFIILNGRCKPAFPLCY
jgi:hypothetical protein